MQNTPELSSLEFNLITKDQTQLSVPLRIVMAVRHWVACGHLKAGDKLPSSRQLSGKLETSRESVEIAYGQLEAEGYLIRKMGSGSYVSPTAIPLLSGRRSPNSEKPTQSRELLSSKMLSNRGNSIFEGGGVVDQQVIRPFVAGVPDLRSFPIDIWKKLYSQVVRDAGSKALQAGDPCGHILLRNAISRQISLQRGVLCTPEQVIILTSSQQALALTATMLFDVGDVFAIENPCYHGARRAYEAAGLRLVPVDVDKAGLCTDGLNLLKNVRGIYITPSHQYPTGATLSLERRQALVAWAKANSVWIIEDDYDSEFHYDGHPTSSIHGLDPNGRTIYVGTFSKSMFPSLRIGYMVVPHKLVQPITTARTIMDGHCSVIPQLALARFIEDGHYSKHVRRMCKVYRARRDIFVSEFNAHLGGIASVVVPSGGLQATCLVSDLDVEQLSIRLALEKNIDLPRLSRLYVGPQKQYGWLAGFAAYTPDEIRQTTIELKKILSQNFSNG